MAKKVLLPWTLILQKMEESDYEVYMKNDKPYNLNIIGLRNPNTQAGKYDDEIIVAYKGYQGVWNVDRFQASTDPGLFWLHEPQNVSGTAILVPGQYKAVYKWSLHRGRVEALCQAGPVRVYRDKNRDNILDKNPETIQEGFFGINIHPGGRTEDVGKWSAGCQVIKAEQWQEFASLIRSAIPLWGNKFTYTLLDV